MAKPFLKWVGGKTQLLPAITERLSSEVEGCKKYIEPFVGGGALLFHLLTLGDEYKFDEYHIIDINIELILCYEALKHDARMVYSELEKLINAYPETHEERGNRDLPNSYYGVRDKWNENLISKLDELDHESRAKRVAQTIFLNKTCFNGLYRVNAKGEFNVPIGSYKKPSFPTLPQLTAVQDALQYVEIHHGSFELCEAIADEHTFLYFDPPYRPISKTSAFTSYTKDGFSDEDLQKLADLYYRLNEKGCLLMMSNSGSGENADEDMLEIMFQQFDVDTVKASRSINSKGDSRGKINEIIVKNSLSNKEVIRHLNGLMIPEVRYTAEELAKLIYENVELSDTDLNPMTSDSKKTPRYFRMVKNALRCWPGNPNHNSKAWPRLRKDEYKSTSKKYIYYIIPEISVGSKAFHIQINDDIKIIYARGRIDDWCVYIHEGESRSAPKDTAYFSYLERLAKEIGNETVYGEFCEIYAKVTKNPDYSMAEFIRQIISQHPMKLQLESMKWYSVLYMAMVSEENYRNTKLGKRLKRLGVYQFLMENKSVEYAANWSRGKGWREIAAECEKHGF